jgi:phage-related protein
MQSELAGDIGQAASAGGKQYGDKFTQTAQGGLASKAKGLFAGFAKAGIVGVAGAAVGIGKLLVSSVGEAREAQQVGARTANVIKSMGNASKISADQVGDLATSLSNKAGIDDEAIQSGENLLLTFGNIRNEAGKGNDIFNQTSGLMVDMSRAMGTDMNGAAIQLGKALNDPIKGVSALSRVGVSFSAQQKDQIKTLVESGKTLDAQKIILGEVKKQFGGAAEAMASPADRAKVAWGNFQEAIGTAVLPIVDKLLTAFADGLPKALGLLGKLGPVLAPVGSALKTAGSAVVGFFSSFKSGGGASQATQIFTNLKDVLTGQIIPAISSVVSYVSGKVGPIFSALGNIIRQNVVPIIQSLASFISGKLIPAVVTIYTKIASNLKPVFDAIYGVIQAKVVPAVALITQKFREWQPTIQKVISVVVLVIGKVLEFAAAILGKVLPPLIKFAGYLIGVVVKNIISTIEGVAKFIGKLIEFGKATYNAGVSVVNFVKGVVKWIGSLGQTWTKIWNSAKSTVASAISSVKSTASSGLNAVLGFFKGLPGKIVGYAKNMAAAGKNLATNVVNGIKNNISGAASAVTSAVSGIPGKIGGYAKSFAKAGAGLISNFVNGMKGAGRLVSDIAGNVWSAVKGLLNSAIGKINAALSFRIPIPGGGINIDPPDIPYLAGGARVTSGTLAVIGEGREPETVLPDSMLRGLLERSAGQLPNVRVFIGTTELTDIVRVQVDDAQTEQTRRLTGGRRL